MSRKVIAILGIVLMVIGAVSFIWGGITYRDREDLIELGDLDVEVETKERIPLPPLVGAVALTGGLLIVVYSRKIEG